MGNQEILDDPNLDKKEDRIGAYIILAIIFAPFSGFIMNYIWKDDYPKSAKAAYQASVITFMIAMLLKIILLVINHKR